MIACYRHNSAIDAHVKDRPLFSSGQLLTADDFTQEQAYEGAKHRRHNRLLHGVGIVRGLAVALEPRPGSGDPTIMSSRIEESALVAVSEEVPPWHLAIARLLRDDGAWRSDPRFEAARVSIIGRQRLGAVGYSAELQGTSFSTYGRTLAVAKRRARELVCGYLSVGDLGAAGIEVIDEVHSLSPMKS